MKMHCPHCGVKGSVDDSYIGRKIRCPKCQETFRCQIDEEVAGDVDMQQPVLPPAEEHPALSPVAETSDAESLKDLADESPDIFSEEETSPVSQLDTFPVASLPLDEAEAVEKEPEEVVPEMESPSDSQVDEDREAEEIEVLLAGDAEVEPVEQIPEQPVEDIDLSEVPDQKPLAADTHALERLEDQEPLRLDDDSCAPASEPAAIEPTLPAAAAVHAQSEKKPPIAPPGRFGQGLKPRTDFTLGEALNEAWQYTKGAKGSIWAAIGMMYLVMLILGLGLGFMQAALGIVPASAAGIWVEIGVQSLISAISTLFTAGLMYMGVRRAAEKDLSWKLVFVGVPMAVKLLIASVLMMLLVISGFVLLILPGIYLAIGYSMTLPLMIDRQLDPWQAMEVSRKAIHKVWWKVFGLFFVMGLIYLVSAIPLGIGLIWTAPMSVILVGVVYRYLFGSQTKKY
ncbi:MAG: zinc-ribbon domain-containing protein [Desulfoprunum sp.]|nr:zinc-ribbon domain-containing protein [Desulfoprunum sp.]